MINNLWNSIRAKPNCYVENKEFKKKNLPKNKIVHVVFILKIFSLYHFRQEMNCKVDESSQVRQTMNQISTPKLFRKARNVTVKENCSKNVAGDQENGKLSRFRTSENTKVWWIYQIKEQGQ